MLGLRQGAFPADWTRSVVQMRGSLGKVTPSASFLLLVSTTGDPIDLVFGQQGPHVLRFLSKLPKVVFPL